ncbi:hypothetical protein EsH8_IV_000866 [Colletotrichum jinshuiense]
MNINAQMEAAKLLAMEFKSGTNSKRNKNKGSGRGGIGGGGSSRVTDGPRMTENHRPEPRGFMNRPMSTRSTHPGANAYLPSPTPTKINPSLANWLTGNNPAQSSSTSPSPAASKVPPTALTSSNRTASVSQFPKVVQPSSSPQAATISNKTLAPSKAETVVVSAGDNASGSAKPGQHDQKAAKDTATNQAASSSRRNGLGQSMWATEETTVVQARNGDTKPEVALETKAEHTVKAPSKVVPAPNADASAKASTTVDPTPQEQPGEEPADDYSGQASRLLLEVDSTQDKTKNASTLQFQEKPKFGTILWALQQLEAGLELPNQKDFKELMVRKDDECANGEPGVTPQTVTADTTSLTTLAPNEQMINDNKKKESNANLKDPACHCPKRSRPVIGLTASKYNTDMDGDVDILNMSTVSQRNFAVNVILQDHPVPDCPVLQQTMAKYPLYFGANPATADDSDDDLTVFPWGKSNNSTTVSSNQQQSPGRGRGLTSSMWAD